MLDFLVNIPAGRNGPCAWPAIIKKCMVIKANNFRLAFFLSLILSCVALTVHAKDNVTVSNGMTKQQVLPILGRAGRQEL